MVTRRRSSQERAIGEVDVTQLAGVDVPGPSINPVDDARRGRNLPAEGDQDRAADQAAGENDGDQEDAHRYCPWCGGSLNAEAKEASTLFRQRMADSAFRYLARVRGEQAANLYLYGHSEGAKHSELIALPRLEEAGDQLRAKTSPNPRRDRRGAE